MLLNLREDVRGAVAERKLTVASRLQDVRADSVEERRH